MNADHSSESGAYDLARRLEEFWHKRGYKGVVCTHEPVGVLGFMPIWGVRSNIARQTATWRA